MGMGNLARMAQQVQAGIERVQAELATTTGGGGEPARPGCEPIGAEEEIGRTVPVIERLVREGGGRLGNHNRKAGGAAGGAGARSATSSAT